MLLYTFLNSATQFDTMTDKIDELMVQKVASNSTLAGRKRRLNKEMENPPMPKKINDCKNEEANSGILSDSDNATVNTNFVQVQSICNSAKDDNVRKPTDSNVSFNHSVLTISSNSKPLQITDLPIECLEHVFNYLCFIDLLNVANWNENLITAAGFVFTSHYSRHKITMTGLKMPRPIEIDDLNITISSSAMCSKVLRIFGHLIRKLQMEYLNNMHLTENWAEMQKLFCKSCTSDSKLVDLKLTNCEEKLFDGIESAFKNVNKLQISCSRLGDYMLDLGKWFSSLNRLELLHNEHCVQIFRFNNVPFWSFLADDTPNACLTSKNIEIMIKSVPQLQTLSLSGGLNMNLLQFFNENLSNLKELLLSDFHLQFEDGSDNDEPNESKIVFKNTEKLSITTNLLGYLPNRIPFEFPNLTELEIGADSFEMPWINFITARHNLVKLQVDLYNSKINDDQLAQIAGGLTNLIELKIVANISPSGLKLLLSQCKSLEKMYILCVGELDCSRCRELAGSKWSMTRNEHGFIFEHKY